MRLSFFDRTFSKVGAGSLRGSIFSLCAAAIGAGVLSLPYVLALCGYAMGLFFMALGATAAIWSNRILGSMACQEKLPNFSKLAERAGGKRLAKLLQGMILVYMAGACISFQIIITSLFKYVCHTFGMSDDLTDT